MQTVKTPPPPPARPLDGHKGTFGTVVVLGGSPTMIGAPALAASAALRGGAGLVKIMTSADVLPFCIAIEPSATAIAAPIHEDAQAVAAALNALPSDTVLAVGPGLSTNPVAQAIVKNVLGDQLPVVLDADGLNNLAQCRQVPPKIRCPLVLTPHPGEYRRLAEASGIDRDPVDPKQRPQAAAALAARYHGVVVLKGRNTVVSDGERQYVNSTGNPALATAGSGDVLTGLIASFIAQRMSPFDAAVLGVYLHGLAADIWADDHGHAGLTARDLAALIPTALNRHRLSP